MASISSSIFGIDHARVRYMRVFDNNLLVTSETDGAPLVCFDADTLERKWEYKGVGTAKKVYDQPMPDIHPEAGHFSSPVYCLGHKKIVCLESKGLHKDFCADYRLIMHVISLEDGSCIAKSGLDEVPNFRAIHVLGERIFRYTPYKSNAIEEVSLEGQKIREITFNYSVLYGINGFNGPFVGHSKQYESSEGYPVIGKLDSNHFNSYTTLTELEQLAFRISEVFIDRHYLILHISSKKNKITAQIGTADLNSDKSFERHLITEEVDFRETDLCPIGSMARNANLVYFTKLNTLFAYDLNAKKTQTLDYKIQSTTIQTLFTTDQFLIGATPSKDCANIFIRSEIRIWSLKDHSVLQTIREHFLQQVHYTGKKLIALIDWKSLKAYDLPEAEL